jgi:hypothetical protein
MKTLVMAICSLLLVGCASVYRQEAVRSLDPSQIAVIEMDLCKNSQCLIVQEVDGKWRGFGWIERYELLPGVRRLKLIFVAPGVHGSNAILVEFDAQAGRTYTIRENADYAARKWNPVVVDVRSQAVVSKQVGTAFAY